MKKVEMKKLLEEVLPELESIRKGLGKCWFGHTIDSRMHYINVLIKRVRRAIREVKGG